MSSHEPSNPATPPVPPGWYPVPGGAYRWWDGGAWTGHVAPAMPWAGYAPGNDNSTAMIAHLGGIFGSILVPIIIYAVKKDQSPFVRHHAAESLNFHLTYILAFVICIPLMFVLIGFFLLLIVVPTFYILSIMASLAAYRGEWYRYPVCLRFFS